MKNIQNDLWQTCHDLLVSKSTCVTSGWMLNAAITMSVAIAFARAGFSKDAPAAGALDDPGFGAVGRISKVKAIATFLFTLLLFLTVLVVTALLSRQVHRNQWIPERFRNTYASGLGFIPAWQWKNVVSAFIIACFGGAVADQPRYLVALVVLFVVFMTAAVQISLEHYMNARDDTTLSFSIVNNLRTSLGLGTGFAVNVLIYACAGERAMQKIWVMTVYVVCMTLFASVLQCECHPMLQHKKDVWPEIIIRSLNFTLIAFNFVVGWAWKGLIDLIVGHHDPSGVLYHCLAATLITVTLSAVLILITVLCELAIHGGLPRTGGLPGVQDLCKLASAMNIGWAWAGFALSCMRHFEEERNAGKPMGMGQVWIFTLMFVGVASLVAVLLDIMFRLIEPKQSAEELPLKSPMSRGSAI